LQRNAQESAAGGDQTRRRLRPVAIGHQIDVDVWSERVADVGGKEIERVERG
jgi:hypothetical protein